MRSFLILLVTLVSALQLAAADALEIYFIDTEGGAATLFITPAKEAILVDTGNPGGRDSKRILDCAAAAGVKQIDHLVTTHYHIDHFGGMAEIAKQVSVKALYDNGVIEGGRDKPNKEYSLAPVDKRVVINPGDELPLKQADGAPKVSLKCICTRQQPMAAPAGAKPNALTDPKRKNPDTSDNANSVVMIFSCGDFRMYLGGDVTWNTEEKIVNPVNVAGTVDVYQVTHHGLDVSNNPVLVNALKPTVAVMMNGTEKGCGPETVATLRDCKSIQNVWQIHKSLRADSATVNTQPEFIANMDKACANNFIKLTVGADAKSYTIAIPATKAEKKYDVVTK